MEIKFGIAISKLKISASKSELSGNAKRSFDVTQGIRLRLDLGRKVEE